MRRRVVNLTILLSLLLCVATVVLWGWSRNGRQWVWTDPGQRLWWYNSGRWSLGLTVVSRWPNSQPFRPLNGGEEEPFISPDASVFPIERLGLRYAVYPAHTSVDDSGTAGFWNPNQLKFNAAMRHNVVLTDVQLRWELPILAFAALPIASLTVAFWRHVIRRRRATTDACLSCGYPLTGNTSGTCPECGTAVSQASRPA